MWQTFGIRLLLLPCPRAKRRCAFVLQPAPRHVLAGHSDVVTCLAVDSGLDLVLSAAADGVLLMHTLRTGR